MSDPNHRQSIDSHVSPFSTPKISSNVFPSQQEVRKPEGRLIQRPDLKGGHTSPAGDISSVSSVQNQGTPWQPGRNGTFFAVSAHDAQRPPLFDDVLMLRL